MTGSTYGVLEICAGAGGQAAGLELAGFEHSVAVEIDHDASETLRLNRPTWKVHEGDVREIDGRAYRGIDVVAGGVPCPPFSVAGKQLGSGDERDLFPEALRLVREAKPAAVMLENVRGLAGAKFAPYRQAIAQELDSMGYALDWQVLNASSYGVPQLRPRFILVAMKRRYFSRFHWPEPTGTPPTVGATLVDLMGANGWAGAEQWARDADGVAPTVVGGSRKHGGADLGPTRSRAGWLKLRVDGKGVANEAPPADTPLDHVPRLTTEMVARIQGFPTEWKFFGRKTSVYRQIGNAFPSLVAQQVGQSIRSALDGTAARKPASQRQQSYLQAVS